MGAKKIGNIGKSVKTVHDVMSPNGCLQEKSELKKTKNKMFSQTENTSRKEVTEDRNPMLGPSQTACPVCKKQIGTTKLTS